MKIFKLSLILIMVAGLIVGCNKKVAVSVNNDNTVDKTEEDASKDIQEDEPFLVITDDLGREIVIKNQPEKVIALSRAYMEELFEIGVTPIAKVEEYKYREEGINLPSISNQSNPDIEKIYELASDLIIANTRQHAEMLDLLEKSGGAVYFLDPNKVVKDPLTDRIELFGELLGKEEEAEDYITHLEQVSDELAKELEKYNYKTGLLIQGAGESIQVAQPTGFYGALLMHLDIENIVEKDLPGSDKSTWVTYDFEQILTKDPDIILIRANGKEDSEELIKKYTENPAWQSLTAIKENKIFVLPSKINPGNISNEEALKTVVKIITSQDEVGE